MLALQAALLLVLHGNSRVYAQRTEDEAHWAKQVRFKISGGASANQHWVNFPELSGYTVFAPRDDMNPGPPNFGNTLSYAWWGGVGVDLPLASTLSLGFLANAQQHNIVLTTIEQTRVGTSVGTSADARIRHSYDVRLLSTGLDMLLAWRPFEGAGLSICAGARGAWLLDRRVFQREELLEPGFGGFTPQGDRVRNVRQGDIQNVRQIQAHALGALRYDIAAPLEGAWLLISPEVQVGYPLTRFTSTEAWQMAFLRAGLSIGIANSPVIKPPEPVLPPPPPPSTSLPSRKQ